MALAFDEGIEIFDKLKKLVYVLDERTHGRMQIEIANGNDYIFRIKFYYYPKNSNEDRNNMITIANDESKITIWYNYLKDYLKDCKNLSDYFISHEAPSLNGLWNTKKIEYSYDADIDVDMIIENTNAVLDVYETGMKIREKALKQLEINFEKFKEKEV